VSTEATRFHRLADELLQWVQKIEPSVTEDLEELALQRGLNLVDQDKRFKGRDETVRKLEGISRRTSDIKDRRLKRSINDALRYTMVSSVEDYAQNFREVLNALREKGYELNKKRTENFWLRDDKPYKGINATCRRGNEQFELQFHTEESRRARDEAHPLYEEFRRSDTSAQQRLELEERMLSIFDRIETPPEVEELAG
jgi:hypothetical protein